MLPLGILKNTIPNCPTPFVEHFVSPCPSAPCYGIIQTMSKPIPIWRKQCRSELVRYLQLEAGEHASANTFGRTRQHDLQTLVKTALHYLESTGMSLIEAEHYLNLPPSVHCLKLTLNDDLRRRVRIQYRKVHGMLTPAFGSRLLRLRRYLLEDTHALP